jgi:hypothetical protein
LCLSRTLITVREKWWLCRWQPSGLYYQDQLTKSKRRILYLPGKKRKAHFPLTNPRSSSFLSVIIWEQRQHNTKGNASIKASWEVGCSRVVESLSSMCRAFSLIPSNLNFFFWHDASIAGKPVSQQALLCFQEKLTSGVKFPSTDPFKTPTQPADTGVWGVGGSWHSHPSHPCMAHFA